MRHQSVELVVDALLEQMQRGPVIEPDQAAARQEQDDREGERDRGAEGQCGVARAMSDPVGQGALSAVQRDIG